MPETLIIIGAGRHGRIVAEIARESGRFLPIGFADDHTEVGTLIDGVPVLGPWHKTEADAYILAIGDNDVRARLFSELIAHGRRIATLISPRAHVSSGAKIGTGTVVLPGACIQAGASIGANVVVNIGVLADHDAEVGDHANLPPGVVLACFAQVAAHERLAPGTVRGGTSPNR